MKKQNNTILKVIKILLIIIVILIVLVYLFLRWFGETRKKSIAEQNEILRQNHIEYEKQNIASEKTYAKAQDDDSKTSIKSEEVIDEVIYYGLNEGEIPNITNLPLSYELEVTNILQNPELPQGCEVTSLAIALNYLGIEADKCDLADNYLPKAKNFIGDPEYYYLGDPRGDGCYCFSNALITCSNMYAKSNEYVLYYNDLTGLDVNTLYAEVASDRPVIVWGTLLWGEPRKYDSGLYSNLHCMVLAGYSEDTVTIIDPIYGEDSKTISKEKFEDIWTKMGSHALVIYQNT